MNKMVRKCLVSWRNKVFHRGVNVLDGTSLNANADIGREVQFGRNCIVLKARLNGACRLDDRVLIYDGADLYASIVDADCRIETGAHIVGSHLEKGVAVHHRASLCRVNVGRFSYIARETTLNEVDIGRFCSIGPGCLIGTGEHPVDRVSTSPVFYSLFEQAGAQFTDETCAGEKFQERRRVLIGHDVWIGAHVFVRDGIRIGNGAIVAAGAVVVKDVIAFEVVGGVPAKRIRSRFAVEVIDQIESIAWWNWPDEVLREAKNLISSANIKDFLEFAHKYNGSQSASGPPP